MFKKKTSIVKELWSKYDVMEDKGSDEAKILIELIDRISNEKTKEWMKGYLTAAVIITVGGALISKYV